MGRFSNQHLDLIRGGGPQDAGACVSGAGLLDWSTTCLFLTLVISVAKIIQTMLKVLQFVICNR